MKIFRCPICGEKAFSKRQKAGLYLEVGYGVKTIKCQHCNGELVRTTKNHMRFGPWVYFAGFLFAMITVVFAVSYYYAPIWLRIAMKISLVLFALIVMVPYSYHYYYFSIWIDPKAKHKYLTIHTNNSHKFGVAELGEVYEITSRSNPDIPTIAQLETFMPKQKRLVFRIVSETVPLDNKDELIITSPFGLKHSGWLFKKKSSDIAVEKNNTYTRAKFRCPNCGEKAFDKKAKFGLSFLDEAHLGYKTICPCCETSVSLQSKLAKRFPVISDILYLVLYAAISALGFVYVLSRVVFAIIAPIVLVGLLIGVPLVVYYGYYFDSDKESNVENLIITPSSTNEWSWFNVGNIYAISPNEEKGQKIIAQLEKIGKVDKRLYFRVIYKNALLQNSKRIQITGENGKTRLGTLLKAQGDIRKLDDLDT